MPPRLRLTKWNEILIAISNCQRRCCYCEKLSRKISGSLTYLRDTIKALANNELIEIKPDKKIKWLYLTGKGKKISCALQEIKEEMK